MMSNSIHHHPSSYRDPSGFIFEKEGLLYRQVNKVFKDDFDFFTESGCYDKLVKKELLIPHERINENLSGTKEWYITLKPERIAFISYPSEWSFDMLKDAALLTLQLLKEAVASGLVLKDANPYNVQWHRGKMIFIDSLSFEKYKEEEPWIAYRQFCESFLSPLLLMHYSKNPLQQLLLAWPEGIPLAVTKSLLPWRSRFSLHVYLHIHLHAAVAGKKARSAVQEEKKIRFSKQKLLNLVTSLEKLIQKLKLPAKQSTWSGYYAEAGERNDYLAQKRKIVENWMGGHDPVRSVVDLGANEGEFSRVFAAQGIPVLATDFDPYCINNLYGEIKKNAEKNIQPLVLDLSNPTPATGVNNKERSSFLSRSQFELALALALVHHLAIGKNIPFSMIASFCQALSERLIIEFVPKQDEKVQLMLSGRKDIYENYRESDFEDAFRKYYTIEAKENISGTGRIMYLMKKKGG